MSILTDGTVEDAVNQGIDPIAYDLTFTRVNESFDPSTGETTRSTTQYTVRGIITEYSKRWVAEGVVQANDRQILILQPSLQDSSGNKVTPQPDDEITYDGQTYVVVDVSEDPASATWVLQGRA